MEPVKIYRERRKLPTQREISKELGVSDAYISMLLSGKRNNPEMLDKIKRIVERKIKKTA